MKSTPSTPTERVTRSRRSTSLHEGLPVHDSPHVRNLRTRSLKKEMDVEAKESLEEEQTQDSAESAPRTPARITRRSLALPSSAEKCTARKTRSLSTQQTIFEDAETEAAVPEDRNSNKSIDVQDRTVKKKRSSVKDVEDGIDSTSRTKCNLDTLSENEQSVDSKIPVLRTSKRLHGNKDSSTEDQPFTRITRRTRRSSSVSSEVPEITCLEKVSEIETELSEVAAKQESTKSEEMESLELVLAQSIETKRNSSESLLEETKKSPIFKKSSVLGTVPETEENSDVQARIVERKSPRNKKKSLDTSEAVSGTKTEMTPESKNNCDIQVRIAEKRSPKTKKSQDTIEALPEIQTSKVEMESVELASAQSIETKGNSSESFVDKTRKSPISKKSSVLGTVQETEENSDVQAGIAVKKSPKTKESPDTTETLPETQTLTNTEEKVLHVLEAVPDSDKNCDVRARIAQKKSPKNKKISPDTTEAVSETKKETGLDVLEVTSETKENCDVRARLAEKKSPQNKKKSPETKAETHKEETVLESNENCDVSARIDQKKSPKNKKKSPGTTEAVPNTKAEANTGTVLDVLEATSETKENCGVRATIAEKKSPKNKKSPDTTETLPETKTETNKGETVLSVLEVVPETKATPDAWPIMDKKKSPQNKENSETVPVTKAETPNETVLDKTMELEVQSSCSIGNLQKKMDQKSAEKPESVTLDLCKFRDIGENEIKNFISVCRQEIEESDAVLLPKTVNQVGKSAPNEKAVTEEKVDFILLLDESNDSIDIPKKVKAKSPHKDNIIDLTFEENSVFDTPQSSPEESISSKTSQKTNVVPETPKTVKEDVDSAKTVKSTKEVRGDSGGGKAKHSTPKKVEDGSKVEDAVSELEILKTLPKESDKYPISSTEVEGSSDGEDAKRKKRKTPKKAVESSGIEKELTKTPKFGKDIEESLKLEPNQPKTPKSTDESLNNEELKHKKNKSEKRNIESSIVQYSVSKLEIPKTVFKESKKTPKSSKIEFRNSEGEEAKPKTPPKKVEESSKIESTVSELETPKIILKNSDKSSMALKEVGSSDGEDVKCKKRKTPKKKAEESSAVEAEQTKTPKFVIDVGKGLKTETPKSTEESSESSNVEEVKRKKKSKSARKNVESSEIEETKEYTGENSEVPDKVPKSGKDTGECSIVEMKTPKSGKSTESSKIETIKPTKTPKSAKKAVVSSEIEETKTPKEFAEECSIVEMKPVKTPKSGKKSTESSEIQTIKPTKTPKSAKKNVEKVNAEISKSVKDENKVSSTVEGKQLAKTVKDSTPESEKGEDEGENSELKSKKHKKKSKSKKDSEESSEVAELKRMKTPKPAREEAEEKSKVEEMKRKKTPKSAKKDLRESSESDQPKLLESPESAEEAEENSEVTRKKRKKSSKKGGENSETEMTKLKRKFSESFKTDPKLDEVEKSSRENSDVGYNKYKKACKDSLESREVKIKPAKTSKSEKKKVSELKEHSDSCTAEMSNDAVVVVNMDRSGWESSSFPEEKKTLEKVKDSSVISKVKSSMSVFTETSSKETDFLNIPSNTESAISFVPVSKIELNEETATNGVPDVPRKKIKKSAEKGYPKELLDLQDEPDLQLQKLIKKLNKKSLKKKCEINDEPDLELKKLTKKLKKKSRTPCEINDEADLEPKKLTKKLKKKSPTKCEIDDEPDMQLKKLLKKLKKKALTKCESDGDEPEDEKLVKLMKQMKKLKKKSLKSSEVDDVGKKRKAKKSSNVDEKKMKLESVKVKLPGVIFTSNIPSSFDRIDVQNLFLEKKIKLLSMRRIRDKTELCIEDAEQISDAVTLLTSNFFGSSVRIDEYPLPTKTNTTTDDDGFPLCRLYVNQIPSHATESDLLSLFPKATRCDLPKKNLKNNRFCYLTFPDKETALEHLALNEKVNFAGHKLGIYPTKKECSLSVYGDMLKEMFLDVADLDELLIVKNLPSDLNQFSVADLFPSVLDVKIVPPCEKKDRSGAAIVVCKNAEQAQMFLEKDIEWKGKKLDVQKTTNEIFNLVMKQLQFDEDELLIYAGRLLKLTNLPKNLTVQKIEKLFPSAILIKVIANRQFAIVAFSTNEEAEKICNSPADKLTIRGKTVEVTHYKFSASDKKGQKKKLPKTKPNRQGRLLHVRGFSPATTVEQLRAIFKDCSVVVTGNRRYAMVKCKTVGKANTYLAKKNLVVRGKLLKIRPAHSIVRQMKQELQLADK